MLPGTYSAESQELYAHGFSLLQVHTLYSKDHNPPQLIRTPLTTEMSFSLWVWLVSLKSLSRHFLPSNGFEGNKQDDRRKEREERERERERNLLVLYS